MYTSWDKKYCIASRFNQLRNIKSNTELTVQQVFYSPLITKLIKELLIN